MIVSSSYDAKVGVVMPRACRQRSIIMLGTAKSIYYIYS